jgi:mannose/fructose/N-acetylgalactosamine-specific phosphotransferase system component IIC
VAVELTVRLDVEAAVGLVFGGVAVGLDMGAAVGLVFGLDVGLVDAAVCVRLEITSASLVQYVTCFSSLSNSVMSTDMSI